MGYCYNGGYHAHLLLDLLRLLLLRPDLLRLLRRLLPIISSSSAVDLRRRTAPPGADFLTALDLPRTTAPLTADTVPRFLTAPSVI